MTALTIDLAVGILGLVLAAIQTWRVKRVKVAAAEATELAARRLGAQTVGQLVAALGRNAQALHDAFLANNHALAGFALEEWMQNVGAILPAMTSAGIVDQSQQDLFVASTGLASEAKQRLSSDPTGEVKNLVGQAQRGIEDARLRTASFMPNITTLQLGA